MTLIADGLLHEALLKESSMSHPNHDPETAAERPNNEPPEMHHGDLRKGAYLKRRADYQMQASAPSASQAGAASFTKPPANGGRRSG